MHMIFRSLTGLALLACATATLAGPCPSTLDHEKRVLAGEERVLLCDRYREQGRVVLGFPSNDFGAQEPGSEKQISNFCRLTYAVDVPMFEKTHARRDIADPLYRALGEQAGEYPTWNFRKYLLDREGRLVGSYPSQVRPDDPRLIIAIEAQL
jgi:glutathione peroxidase